jgi:2-oxoglutarate dehydrogenase E2 component (dihydrolipoamide succinyltransferase)
VAVEIKVPSAGESVTEGTLSRWLKREGESVRIDEPVVELETDKATTEVAAPDSGVLHILVPEGQTVAIGTVIGNIEASAAPGARGSPSEQPSPIPAPSAAPQAAFEARRAAVERRRGDEPPVKEGPSIEHGGASRVAKEDVAASVESRAPEAKVVPTPGPVPRREEDTKLEAPAPSTNRETRRRMSSIRQRIAERLVASQHATATLTTFNEVDMSAVMALRKDYQDHFLAKHHVKLGLMSFFVKACVDALRVFPVVNARIDGNDIVFSNAYDIGVAVSTDKGLMVPVVRNADRLGFAEIEKRIAELTLRARDGKITVEDLQGGSFTITNGGTFGSLLSTPILNPPQSAILGMHAIQKRAVVINDQVVARPMMYVALSYDHRLVDGREAVLFLVRIKECIEHPERWLLEV